MVRSFHWTFITTTSSNVDSGYICETGLYGILVMVCTHLNVFLAATKPFCGLPRAIATYSTSIMYVSRPNIRASVTIKGRTSASRPGTPKGKTHLMFGKSWLKIGKIVYGI